MVPDLRGLNDGICTDMYMVPDFHGVVVEGAAVGFVGRSILLRSVYGRREYLRIAHLMMQFSATRQYRPREITTE